MRIQSIHIQGFRNLINQTVELSDGINLLIGDNGQGKTNLLEALHVLATLRSFRASSLRDLIHHEAKEAELFGEVFADEMPLKMRLRIDGKGRQLWLGDKAVRSVAEYLGSLSVVAFTPDDLSMIKGAPALRRRFIDRAAFLFRPSHLQAVRDFSTSLKARNRLLQEDRAAKDPALLASFSEILAEAGSKVSATRAWLIEMLSPRIEEILSFLSDGHIRAQLRFHAGWKHDSSFSKESLAEALDQGLERDRRRGKTGTGPQGDDLDVVLNQASARRYASQGQQRAVAVALMLAVVDSAVSSGAEQPVILLDDVSSELDALRRDRLFERVRAFGGQVLITATEAKLVEPVYEKAAQVLTVHEGRIEPVGGGL